MQWFVITHCYLMPFYFERIEEIWQVDTNGSRLRTKNQANYEKFTQTMTILHKPSYCEKIGSEV